jgi:cell division protein FtsI/penicillin-binding protein 2
MMNLMQLQAKFDPHYQLKLQEAHGRIYAEQMRGQATLEREYIRANSAMDVARFNASMEDQRQQAQGQTALQLSTQEHAQKLEQMQAALDNNMALAGMESGILAMHKIMDESTKVRASTLAQFEEGTKLRGDLLKMGLEYVLKEKLAQKQHARDMEMASHQNQLQAADRYWHSVCAYLDGLLGKGLQDRANEAVNDLWASWVDKY